jgi:hypothetical protein
MVAMDPLTWILWAWLCNATTRECSALPDRPMASYLECRQAVETLREVNGGLVIAHCRRAHGQP